MRSGVRGFVVGSFALIVLYVGLQPNSPRAVAAGGNVLIAGLRRLLSADVAGVPQRKGAAAGKPLVPGATVGSVVGGAIGGTGGGPTGATVGSVVGHVVGG